MGANTYKGATVFKVQGNNEAVFQMIDLPLLRTISLESFTATNAQIIVFEGSHYGYS